MKIMPMVTWLWKLIYNENFLNLVQWAEFGIFDILFEN